MSSNPDLKRPASPHPEQRPSKVVNTSDPNSQGSALKTDVSSSGANAPSRTLLIKRLHENARLPTRGSALAAGYDLYACVTLISSKLRYVTEKQSYRVEGRLRLSQLAEKHSSTRASLWLFLKALMEEWHLEAA
jgi:hypothetical protein